MKRIILTLTIALVTVVNCNARNPIETALGNGKANWTLAGIGAGLATISIPISAKANKNGIGLAMTF